MESVRRGRDCDDGWTSSVVVFKKELVRDIRHALPRQADLKAGRAKEATVWIEGVE